MKIQEWKGKVYRFFAYIDVLCTAGFTKKDILGFFLSCHGLWNVDSSIALRILSTLIFFFFLPLDVSSALEAPLALVLEDDVLDLRLVLEDALARVLCLLHLDLRNILFRGCEISKVSFVSPTW